MICLPLIDALSFVSLINPRRVKEENKEHVLSHKKECYEALRNVLISNQSKFIR